MSDKPLGKHTIKGSMWEFAVKVIQRILDMLRIIVLARLLTPADFGVFDIAILVIMTLETFSRTGFVSALIQKKGDIEPYLDTVWTIHLIRSVILAGIMFLSAGIVGAYFNEPDAASVIRWLSVSVVINGLTNIGVVYFSKDLRFDKRFVIQSLSLISNNLITLVVALVFRTMWALVYGHIISCLLVCITTYIMHPYRPRPRLDLARAMELFRFGKWLLGTSILAFLVTQGDDLFVLNVLGVTALGLYRRAFHISNIPSTDIASGMHRVTFAVYSKIHEDIPRLQRAYFNVLQTTSFLVFPIAGSILVLGEDFTRLCLGEQWMEMVPALQVMSIAGLFRALLATTHPLFEGAGKPDLITKIMPLRLLVLGILIYPLSIRWSLVGTSMAVLISNAIALAICLLAAARLTQSTIWAMLSRTIRPMINSSLVLSCTYYVRFHFENSGFPLFLSCISGILLGYLMLALLIDRDTLRNVRSRMSED